MRIDAGVVELSTFILYLMVTAIYLGIILTSPHLTEGK